jgi:hypothetical protein
MTRERWMGCRSPSTRHASWSPRFRTTRTPWPGGPVGSSVTAAVGQGTSAPALLAVADQATSEFAAQVNTGGSTMPTGTVKWWSLNHASRTAPGQSSRPGTCLWCVAGVQRRPTAHLSCADLAHVAAPGSTASWAPAAEARLPRLAGVGGPAGSDLLPKFAGLWIGPATAGGASPAFMETRYSGSTVSTTVRPTMPRVS